MMRISCYIGSVSAAKHAPAEQISPIFYDFSYLYKFFYLFTVSYIFLIKCVI